MGLDDFTPIESSEGGSQSTEISEKFKESYKKGSAGIQRTKKDEKKSKKYDLLLAGFLVKIIIDKKYDGLLEYLFKCTNFGYPSNFLLGILSLVNILISNEIREVSCKEKIIYDFKSEEEMIFDDNTIPKESKNRINYWIEDMIDVVSIEHSMITTNNLLNLIKEKNLLLTFTSKIFIFFLQESNIIIQEKPALNISEFILEQVISEIKKLEIEEI